MRWATMLAILLAVLGLVLAFANTGGAIVVALPYLAIVLLGVGQLTNT